MDFEASLAHTQVELIPGSKVGVLALHAGLEGGVGSIARQVAVRTGASLLCFWQESSDWRLHLTSSCYDPAMCSELRVFLSQCRVIVSLHGHHRLSLPRSIFVGGGHRGLARKAAFALRLELRDIEVVAALRCIPHGLRGLHPANPVNLAPVGGVQVELPPVARGFAVPIPGTQEVAIHDSAGESTAQSGVINGLARFIINSAERD
jgi:phage replication-related protein YjqB (UPF0714/DUF867 family)